MPKILGRDIPLNERIEQLDELTATFLDEAEVWLDGAADAEGENDGTMQAYATAAHAGATLALVTATQAATLRAERDYGLSNRA